MVRETRVDGVSHGLKTRKEALVFMWKRCGGHDMVALTMLWNGTIDYLYAYFLEEVA